MATPPPATDPLAGILTPDVLAALTAGGGTQKFIGLPAGAEGSLDLAPGAAPTAPKAPPRYTVGAEMLPTRLNAVPTEIAGLQDRLVDSGLLTGPFQHGYWDKPSQAAFTEILTSANFSGNDWDTELTNAVNNGTTVTMDPKTGKLVSLTPGQKKLKSIALDYTNSDDLATVANDTAQKKLGRYLTQDELNKFVDTFHAQQSSTAQQKAAGLGADMPPSPSGAASTFAEQVDPIAAQTRTMMPMIQSVNQALSGLGMGEKQPMA